MRTPLLQALGDVARLPGRLPASAALLVLRIALAVPFWRSGLTKWDGFLSLSDRAVFLFSDVFRLHIFGASYAYPAPALMALLAGVGEIVLPILLVLGFGTRLAAFGILMMTAIIQLTVPEGWANFHLPWAAMALALMAFGPGRLSVDHMLATVFGGRPGDLPRRVPVSG
ncbi:MAG: DoxX family protein [Alphaproteobacteria bacterium]